MEASSKEFCERLVTHKKKRKCNSIVELSIYLRTAYFKTWVLLRPLFRTFIGLFDLFKHVVGAGATVEFFFCKKAIRRGTELSGNSKAREKKFQDKKFPLSQFFWSFNYINFSTIFEVRFSPFTSQVWSSFLKKITKIFGLGNSNGQRYCKMLSFQWTIQKH